MVEINAILLITDKFYQFIRYIAGRTGWTSQEWSRRYVDVIYTDWGMP